MERNNPKVCVIMPVYNGEKTIKYALASLLCQSYNNWICVIVNDGSTDSTTEILGSLKDPRFHVYNLNKNYGRGIARDKALKYAEGDYLAFLDVDDMMHEDKLKEQVYFLEDNPDIRMVSCGCITINENFEALRAYGLSDMKSDSIMTYGQALPLLLPATMVRLDQAKMFSYNHFLDVGEDYDFLARYCEGYKYANIGKPYYYYLIGNVTARKLIYYQFNSLRCRVVLWQRGYHAKAILSFIKRCLKIICYCILIPFVGVDKLINKRGKAFVLSSSEKKLYAESFDIINKTSQLI